MSAVRAGRVVKSRGRRPKKSVLRMMAIMTDGNKEELPKEFIEGGRTGRRNAMPDILHSDANVTTADLPERLQQLATSEVQSSSSPSSIYDCYSSCNSDNILMTFLESDGAGRRHAVGEIPFLNSTDQATTVASTVFTGSISEEMLERFLQSGCCQRRDAIPCINPPCNKKRHSVGTTVSESSWKYCCSQECLDQFLKSHCSKRRTAVPCIKVPGPHASTSVHSNELPIAMLQADYVRHFEIEVPRRATQVIQINKDTLAKMLNDPNNPEPGPSSGSTSPEEANKNEKQEGS